MMNAPRARPLALSIALLALGSPGAAADASSGTAERPNVILMVADDLGYGDLAVYNPKAKGEAPFDTPIETPHLSRLADEGATLTRFYASGAKCAPTRRALLTGRYQSRLGEWAEGYRSKPGGVAADDNPAFSVWLNDAGYQTAAYGKWNIGDDYGVSGPGAHGFDDWLVIEHNTGYFDHRNRNPDCRERECLFGTGGERVTDLKGNYLTDIFADRALDFIDARDADRPFFLYLPWAVPHKPLQAPGGDPVPFDAAPENRTPEARRTYVDMVEHLDARIGDILAKLEAAGIADETIVIFTSDNGGHQAASNNWPLRRAKQWLYEGGIRVPAIVRWPGEAPSGVRIGQTSIIMDLPATILEAADANRHVPEGRELDGIDLAPFLRAPDKRETRTLGWRNRHWSHQRNYLRQEALSHGPWKLVRTYPYAGPSGGLPTFGDDYRDELFNVAEDLDESEDLSDERPEKLAEMRERLDAWRAEVVNRDAGFQIPAPDQRASSGGNPSASTSRSTTGPAASGTAAELAHRYRFNNGGFADVAGNAQPRPTQQGKATEAPGATSEIPPGAGDGKSLRLGVSPGKTSGWRLPNSIIERPRGAFSVWIRPSAPIPQTAYLLYAPPLSTGLALKGYKDDRLLLLAGGERLIAPEGAAEGRTWRHVAATWNAEQGAAALYIDGERVAATDAIPPNGFALEAEHSVRVGNWFPPGGAQRRENQFEGLIHDLRFYQGVLSADDVRRLHASPGTKADL